MVWVSWVLGDTQSLSLHKVKSFSPFPRAQMYMAIHFSPETQENQLYCYDNYNILKQLCVTKSLYSNSHTYEVQDKNLLFPRS